MRYGVAQTRLADVAAEAGVSRPLLYQYFADRAALVEAMIDEELARLVERLRRRIPQKGGFRECVVRLSVASIDIGRQDDLLADLMANSPYGDLTAQLLQPHRRAHDLVHGLWRPVLERGRVSGELRSDISDEVIVEWIMMTHHVFFVRRDIAIARVAELYEAFVLPGLLEGAPPLPHASVPTRRRPAAPASIPRVRARRRVDG